MIDKSFLEGLSQLVSKAETPKLVPLHDSKVCLSANGTDEYVDIPPARRDHLAESLESIFAFAGKFPASSIWYNSLGVVVLADDGDRRDRMTMPLTYSTQISTFSAWEGKGQTGCVLKQREAILLLRTVFRDCLRSNDTLIKNMRVMKSTIGGAGESAINKDKRSIDKRLEHQWTGGADIPDYVTFNVPIFRSRFEFEGFVEVAIDSNPESETFAFIPIPGSITAAIEDAEAKIGEHLRTLLPEHERIYYGSPTMK